MPIPGDLNELEVISVDMYRKCRLIFYLGGELVDCSFYVSGVRALSMAV